MNILVIGSDRNYEECESKFGTQHTLDGFSSLDHCLEEIKNAEIVFDFRTHLNPIDVAGYIKIPFVFLNTTNVTLEKICAEVKEECKGHWFGFNGLPSFILNDDLEVCVRNDEGVRMLEKVCLQLPSGYTLVKDQVGMVTPRIICMIINEAFYTLEEKTASREDIDLAMKLGTNYPYGPFEWCNKIGAEAVCELLNSLHSATGEDRFKICPLLQEESKVNLGNS